MYNIYTKQRVIMGNIDMDFEIFKGKSFSSLLKDIYENQQGKKKNISGLIEELRKLIRNPQDAIQLTPMITQLINASISNDDHLVKMATIAQRLILAEGKSNGEDGWLSDEDRKQLMEEIEDTATKIEQKTDDKLEEIEQELEQLRQGIK
jgi:hypothetical protein